MELTRRDALAALVVMGGGIGAGSAMTAQTRRRQPPDGGGSGCNATMPTDDSPPTDHVLESMVAVARVIYPTSISGVDCFVRTVVTQRSRDRPNHVAAIARLVARLDELAQDWHEDRLVSLNRDTRDRFLREVGADTAVADPTGTIAQQARYYLINELLFALYASPVGGTLVEIENPQGYPGGLESYQRRPRR